MTFDPKFEIRMQGQVTAEFTGKKTTENIAAVVDWIKAEKWRGCLEINVPGNGGVNTVIFREAPKRLEETELPY